MKGLISRTPAPSAVRLVLSGFLLLLDQSVMLLLIPGLNQEARALIWMLTPLALVALIAALIGLPDPPAHYWRRRHGR